MNSNDFDDLFKRASEKYPLRADSADWNKIARALDDDPSLIIPAIGVKEKQKKRRRLVWLFFIFPLALSGYYFWNNGFSYKEKTIAGKTIVLPGSNKDAVQPENKSKNTAPNVTINKNDVQNTNSRPVYKEHAVKGTKDEQAKNITEPTVTGNTPLAHYKTENWRSNGNPIISAALLTTVKKNHNKIDKSHHEEQHYTNNNKQSQNSPEPNSMKSSVTGKVWINAGLEALEPWNVSSGMWSDPVMKITKSDLLLSNINNNTDSSHHKTVSKSKKPKQSYFYTGVTIAPDISTIKFQSIKGTGYTAGVLLGYQVSPKLALETGIYLDSKKYYSKGEYFSTKNVPQLNYVDLLKVQGTCNMLEVPLNLRYNFYTGGKTTWFATTGLSTYFMFKEGYDYSYLYYGNPREKYYSYNKSSQYWFSILNISAGYEHNIGKIGNLRVEPYVRIPLTGMGTGSLPIMSAGLNIGITHRIK